MSDDVGCDHEKIHAPTSGELIPEREAMIRDRHRDFGTTPMHLDRVAGMFWNHYMEDVRALLADRDILKRRIAELTAEVEAERLLNEYPETETLRERIRKFDSALRTERAWLKRETEETKALRSEVEALRKERDATRGAIRDALPALRTARTHPAIIARCELVLAEHPAARRAQGVAEGEM